jgi:hypothetical protein
MALTLVALKPQSLRSHSLCLFIKSGNLLVELLVFRFRWIAATQLSERFFNREFRCFSHGALVFR